MLFNSNSFQVFACISGSYWTSWSEWSACNSIECDNRVRERSRLCTTESCNGETVQYKLHSVEEYVSGKNARENMCSTFNSIPIDGELYDWKPTRDPLEQCSLTCHDGDQDILLTLDSPPNGLGCNSLRSAVCAHGKCLVVICPTINNIELCRLCDANAECTIPSTNDLYKWKIRWTPCSASCGVGYRESESDCFDTRLGQNVDDGHCGPSTKPDAKKIHCSGSNCEYKWETGKWSPCDVTCGGGISHRNVECTDVVNEDSVAEIRCEETKPFSKKACNWNNCTSWVTGEWTKCSATCGEGEQYRTIECQQKGDGECNETEKPMSRRVCQSGSNCDHKQEINDHQKAALSNLTLIGVPKEIAEKGISTLPSFVVSAWNDCSVSCGSGVRKRNVSCQVYLPFQRRIDTMTDSSCSGKKPDETKLCHDIPCPANAEGSELNCTVANCRGHSSSQSESDSLASTPVMPSSQIGSSNHSHKNHSDDFHWNADQYTPCSKSCLKGFQETVYRCVRMNDSQEVSDSFCSADAQSEKKIKECNDIPCPPRWEIGEFSQCTAVCGGGFQHRKVQCVQDVSTTKTVRIPDYRCPLDIPTSIQFCNSRFCPAHWEAGTWSKCSVTCGMGIQRRTVYCVEMPLSGHKVNVSDNKCLEARPPTARHCQAEACFHTSSTYPKIKAKNETYIQLKRLKKVHLHIGGKAYLLPRQAVKIRCPVRNLDKKLIFWTKNNRLVPTIGRVKVSRYGVLKISRTEPDLDKGVYTCLAKEFSADITLDFYNKKKARKMAESLVNKIDDATLDPPKEKLNIIDGGLIRDSTYKTVYVTSNWTECPLPCGKGFQKRTADCVVLNTNYIKYVRKKHCEKLGVQKPKLYKKCSDNPNCPHWKVSPWSNCTTNHCIKSGIGTMTRDLLCVHSNGTRAPKQNCLAKKRPTMSTECEHKECEAVWHAGDWTQCHPKCGHRLRQRRILTCVWKSNKRPAYSHCNGRLRPATFKMCKPKPCRSRCYDESRFCNVVKILKMCRYKKFTKKCCRTCRYMANESWIPKMTDPS